MICINGKTISWPQSKYIGRKTGTFMRKIDFFSETNSPRPSPRSRGVSWKV